MYGTILVSWRDSSDKCLQAGLKVLIIESFIVFRESASIKTLRELGLKGFVIVCSEKPSQEMLNGSLVIGFLVA